eukprot:GFUD01027243.1.p1 GENE.GFUD01027243.1~~GFUD01027243.1.p1  ORF type:complete len:362 (+),score=88.00 GFUD01027243.1:70-1086(+)
MECSASLSLDFYALLEDSSLSDITIQNQGGQISVHSVILSARSPVFRNMLKNDMEEKKTGIIKIEDFEINVVKAMVNYIYSAKIDENFDDMRALVRIGAKYQIQSLVDKCCKLLISSISSTNVVDLGVLAETYSFQAMLKKCAEFIADDLDSLGEDWEEKVKKSPVLLLHILKCLKRQKGQEVVEIVRFSDLIRSMEEDGGWSCGGSQKDAITFQVNRASKLSEIGFYGTEHEGENIIVDIEVKKGEVDVFTKTTNFRSAGNNVPVKIPVDDVTIEPDTEYTVAVKIEAADVTFSGNFGVEEVESSDHKFLVKFFESDISENYTDVTGGQIPTLVFKI